MLKKVREYLLFVRPYIGYVLSGLVLLALIGSLVIVGIGNDALFQNTKLYESTSAAYVVPDWYSLSEMKVEYEKTYYEIKEVVYTFASKGPHFAREVGILTLGYKLGMYGPVLWVVLATAIYLAMEYLRSLGQVLPLKEQLLTTWTGRLLLLQTVLFIILVLQLLFPLL